MIRTRNVLIGLVLAALCFAGTTLLDLSSQVRGVLGLGNGGTNYASNTGAAGKVLIGDGAGHFVEGDPLVQGLYPDGGTTQGNPVLIGGWTGTANKALAVDSSGRPTVNVNGTVGVNQTQINGQTVTTTDNGTQGVALQATASATGALGAPCKIVTAASTNATNCKASAGNLYGFRVLNTTTTTYWLLLFNASGTPTCTGTPFLAPIPIAPAAAAGQVGGEMHSFTLPYNFSSGIAYCITADAAGTTSAATGVYGGLETK